MKTSRFAMIAVLVLTCSTSSVRADTYPRQAGVDVLHYVFRLTLDDASDEIAGEATVRVRFVADGVKELFLDLASLADGKGMTVSSVASDGRALAFTHRDDRLQIPLTSTPQAGQEMSFTIAYQGAPAEGLRFRPNKFGERTIFSDSWPNQARQWLPVIDHPYDKATGELIVTAPAHYQVVANGLLIEELDLADGRRRTHWQQSVPIASWLYTIGVARFAVHHGKVTGIPLQSWVFPQESAKGYSFFEETTRRAMELFSDRIGPYPYEKLASVQAPGLVGGTEYATAIFYGEGVFDSSGPGLIPHEVAHQWFGNSVTERDWDDVWLSEGFASYFALLYAEHFEGRDVFVERLQRQRKRALDGEQQTPDTPIVHQNLSDMSQVINGLVYWKGAWTLHMLRRLIGDASFWRGIQEYYRRYRDQNASTAELRQIMEAASGMDLTWFFDQWLYRSGAPRVDCRWRYDSEHQQVEVELSQTQASDPFRLPVDIGLVLASQEPAHIERVELLDRQATFRFGAETKPVSVVLDPDTWLLAEEGTVGELQ